MLPLRRAALRALSARPTPSALLFNPSRTFVTRAAQTLRPQQQWSLSSLQKRFASDEAKPSESTVTDETVTETPSEAEQVAAAEVAAESPAPPAHEEASSPAEPATDALGYPGTNKRTRFGAPADPSKTLYVGNLFFETSEDAVRSLFETHGKVESTKIIYDQNGLSKGFAYVTFAEQEDAARAIDATNQDIFQGRRLTVQFHRPRAPRENRPSNPPSKTLFIGNMSFEMSDKDLNDLFREVRNVLDVRVAIDRRSGQPRGFAHADFADVPSATKALELLRTKEIYGRKLRVDYSASNPRSVR